MGKGSKIPINHPAWFNVADMNHNGSSSLVSHVSDLIDSTANSSKVDLVRNLYPHQIAMEIFQYPSPKIDVSVYKLILKHSTTSDYKVKRAYEMLLGVPNRTDDLKAVQSIIWKLKLPVKIIAFFWKLLHYSLQVKLTFVEVQNETGS